MVDLKLALRVTAPEAITSVTHLVTAADLCRTGSVCQQSTCPAMPNNVLPVFWRWNKSPSPFLVTFFLS